ncbi:MAG: elongation factor G [Bryobacteraceae bacterium]
MRVYEGSEIRNVALAGHGHSGKTSLTAAILYTSGATNRLTRVDDGTTLTDYDDEEIARKITISTSLATAEWKKQKINLLDTPGFNLFISDAKLALGAADAAFITVDGVSGVEVQTEKVWHFSEEFGLPRALVINKLDRDRSSFERTVSSIQTIFGRAAVPVHLPIGSERDFKGIVDLVTMKAYTYTAGGDGKATESEIPADLADEAQAAHEVLVEMAAEGNDTLLEEFFAEGTLPIEHIVDGLREGVHDHRIFPILCASAALNIGADLMMSFALDYFPAPVDRGPFGATHNGDTVRRAVKDSEAPAAFVFKTAADPFAGRVTYFKVMSGVIKNDASVVNSRTSQGERLSHISCAMGKTLTPVTELKAGDLGAVAKLKDTLTGDTLYDKAYAVEYPHVEIPEPSIAYAISAKTRNDEDRMGNAIHKILEEDPTLRFYRDPQTKEFLLAGNGQQHVEIICSRLKKRYSVDVELHAPKIPYRETIRGTADVQGRHKKQTGGHGQFGDCWIKVEPLPRGEKFQFDNDVFGGSIPKNFIPAVEKGIIEAAANGYLAGYPVVDFKVSLYDGSYHDVDSSEMSFKMAARKAFKAAMAAAKPALLEPVMKVEVQAPVEYAGDLMGDMNGRRGRISGMDTNGATQIIRAQVPMSEMLTYQNDLISMTQGRATFHMDFDHYDFVPSLQAEKVIAAARAARTGVEEEDE